MVKGALVPIAKPLANPKFTKKVLKVVKTNSKSKQLRRGVKEVVKSIRKGKRGICVIAGDISPLDVISHLPVYCEENDIPYIFVDSKDDLGAAASTKRPTSCVLAMDTPEALKNEKAKKKYEDVIQGIKELEE
ncbi:putative H/ACA ribonucleoprotein complex subunit 2 [Blattamonas nauphoetae]|uniref:H/ACA ribonucleoprotein complex subunit 2 n=1 Tax=Blattamonas nauphoetae TaxID=2049346 RepID=A0ABQ9XFR8_9EUKA|nr:putative H/ACA ribonucleoprotein complex subunit 2 [Blattamonas nauphoetae]